MSLFKTCPSCQEDTDASIVHKVGTLVEIKQVTTDIQQNLLNYMYMWYMFS